MTGGRDSEPGRWRRLDALLDALLDAAPDERERLLAAAAADDPDLAAEARALLASDAGEAGPLDRDAGERFGGLLAAVADAEEADPAAHLVGRDVGPYRILGLLGTGGMGVVFEARQTDPPRTVALKILRAGVFADERQRRLFRREAESLARLAHPAIAAIHEAGRTADGLHYFAMELVRGDPLDAHLAGRPAPVSRAEIDARLALFLEVCDAISHAHQRGVIHLDLKPSNILVLPPPDTGRTTGRPSLKVLDFGVARITGGEAAAATLTAAGAGVYGTLAYMSPEQASGDADAVDVRSDIYSLGVLLYEALADALPVDVRGLRLHDAVRAIREAEPARPGDRARALRGDLETILLKALAKDPERRYQSVDALAEDIRRFRDDLPVLARAPSTVYHLRKIVRRHRVWIGVAAALVLALLAAVGGTSWGLVRARRAEAAAHREAATAEQVAAFLERVFRVNNPGESRGNAVTARELLDKAVGDIDDGLADQPLVRGRLLGTMGTAYRNLGLYREARPLMERSLALQAAALGPQDLAVARMHYLLGSLLRRQGEYDSSRVHHVAALAIRERALGPAHTDVGYSLTGLANLEVDRGDYAAARGYYERALANIAARAGEECAEYAAALANLALAELGRGEREEAARVMERALAIQRRALAPDDLDLAWSLSTLATVYQDLGRADEARPLAEEALGVQERILGPDHTDVGETLSVLAAIHRAAGRHEESLALARRALGLWENALGPDHPATAMALDNVARDLGSLGRPREAIPYSERARALFAHGLPPGHPSLAMNLVILGELYAAAGDPGRARATLADALALREAHQPGDTRALTEVLRALARVERQAGRAQAAKAWYDRALATLAAGGGAAGSAAGGSGAADTTGIADLRAEAAQVFR